MTRQLHLNAFLKPGGEYLAGWRHPDAVPDAGVNFRYIADLVRTLEAAKFDSVFLPDLVGIPASGQDVLTRVAVVNDSFEPTTLLGALAALTRRIGLVATASTSYNQPYTLARVFASLDYLSGGRIGWNVVTSLNDSEAQNFGLTRHLDHAERHRRAEEFFDVVTGLWDSFDDDAFMHDVSSGQYFSPEKLHWLNHRGEHFQVAGPLNIARPPQGWPVIAQAGASGAGKALAARVGEMVFTSIRTVDEARVYRQDLRARAQAFGRSPDQVKVFPNLETVIAPTREEAQDKFGRLRALLHPRVSLGDVEYWLGGVDLSQHPLDAPLPPLPPSNGSLSTQQRWYAQAQRDQLTLGDFADLIAGGNHAVIGTPQDVADHIEHWFTTGAADGFNVAFPYLPTTLTDFTALVVPELQRRGLFRREYTATTLRGHLGLTRPGSRYAHSTGAEVEVTG